MGKILFIRGGAIGDFILTLPAIQLARRSLPGVEIEILGYEPAVQLAKAAKLADATRSIEYGPLSAFFIPNTLLSPELMGYFKSFSVVVSYLYDPDGYFEGNLRRSGVETLFIGPHKVDESLAGQHAAAQLARPLEQLALFLEQPWIDLSFGSVASDDAGSLLQRAGIGPATQLIALHPGSGSPRKNWSFEGWSRVAASLASRLGGDVHFLVISGEAEDTIIHEFHDLLDREGVDFTPVIHCPLPCLGALLQRCRLFLGHDSGISHLAGACGIRGVLLFGPTDPEIWAPRNPAMGVVRSRTKTMADFRPEEVTGIALEKWRAGENSPQR